MYLINQIEMEMEKIIGFIKNKNEFNNIILNLNLKGRMIEYINLEQLRTEQNYEIGDYFVKISDNEIVFVKKYTMLAEGIIYNKTKYRLNIIYTWKIIQCDDTLIDELIDNKNIMMYNYKIPQININVINANNKIAIYGNHRKSYQLIDNILKNKHDNHIKNSVIVSSDAYFDKYNNIINRLPNDKHKDIIETYLHSNNDGCIIIVDTFIDTKLCDLINKSKKMVIVCDVSIINTSITFDCTILFDDNIYLDNRFQLYNGNPASKFPLQLEISSKTLENIYKELIRQDKGMVIKKSNIYWI
jgi:hypothetical protein